MERVFLAGLMIFLAGCTTAGSQTKPSDNTLHLSLPELTVKVGSRFKYLGDIEYTKTTPYESGLDPTGPTVHEAIFAVLDGSGIKEICSVRTTTSNAGFSENFFEKVEGKLEEGVQVLGDEYFHYYIKVITPSAAAPATNYIAGKGYTMPGCMLSKQFGQRAGDGATVLFSLIYLEDLESSGFDCSDWQASLIGSQWEYLKGFDKRSTAPFTVLRSE